ncbi:MAG: VanZ family protein [Clostridia bacterium]|nr:VanZ family protein [Clostridia bacterium]
MTKIFRVLPYILLTLNLLFIFGNSVLDGPSSRVISTKAEEAIEQVVGKDIENDPYEVAMYGRTFNAFLRKCAHAAEFFSLAVLSYICAAPLKGAVRPLSLILMGIGVPLLDETLQLFHARSGLISDMWIDITGYAAGAVLMLVIEIIYNLVRKKRQENE